MSGVIVDVVSDMVCPWCFIGTRRLNAVLAKHPELEAVVRFHPFQLDPSTPPEGRDLREHLRAKYRADPDKMFGRVEQIAKETGIPLDFSKVRRMSNTLDAHTLANAAAEKGTQRALVEAFFAAYFLEGRDIGNRDELVSIASKHGFGEDEAIGILGDESRRKATRDEARAAAEEGIDGVPFFIFGEKVAFGGAQPEAIFEQAIARAR